MADIPAFVSKGCLGRPAPPRKGQVFIHGMERRSVADSAGLKVGDRIRDYDGKRVRDRDGYRAAVEAA